MSHANSSNRGIPMGIADADGRAEEYVDYEPHEKDEIDNAEQAMLK